MGTDSNGFIREGQNQTKLKPAVARNEQERTNFLAQAPRFIRKVRERHENVTAQLADLTGPLPGPVK
jgi:hypothetical protein